MNLVAYGGSTNIERHGAKLSCHMQIAPKIFTPIFCAYIVYIIIFVVIYIVIQLAQYTGLFISPSRISELDCATAKTDTAEGSISIGRESLKVFFVLGAVRAHGPGGPVRFAAYRQPLCWNSCTIHELFCL